MGMHGKFFGTIFGLGKLGASGFGLYQTYTADSATEGGNATYMCYASNGIGTLIGLRKLLSKGPGGKPPKGSGGRKGPSGNGGGYYYYRYYL